LPRIAYDCRGARFLMLMRGGIAPVFGRSDPSSAQWVMMDVVQLLEHHRVVEDGLGMVAFLPDLITAVGLVGLAKRFQAIKEPAASFAIKLLQETAGGEFLQVAHDSGEVRGGYDGMEVVLHDNPCVELQLLVSSAVVEGADQDVAARGGGEDWKPADDCGGDEVRSVGFVDAIDATHGAGSIAWEWTTTRLCGLTYVRLQGSWC